MRLLASSRLAWALITRNPCRHVLTPLRTAGFHTGPILKRTHSRRKPLKNTDLSPQQAINAAFQRLVNSLIAQLVQKEASEGVLAGLTYIPLQTELSIFQSNINSSFMLADRGSTARADNPLYWRLRRAFAERDVIGLRKEVKYLFISSLLRETLTAEADKAQRKLADFRFPYEWFPATRALQRTVHVHVGPTNSGKTYQALKALEAAKTGLYAGPLRLLAHETYSRLLAKGKPCALVTGEEIRLPPDTDIYYTGCTVEMTPLNKKVDVAVIDEIQMLADPDRGAMWTVAFLGVQAKEVHVCGEDRAVPIIRSLCASTGDKCIIHRYQRLSPLETLNISLNGDFQRLRKGDAVVAFSRLTIHALKKQIQEDTGRKCAVIYGHLPPEVRAQQAALFNDPNNEYDFLVASDAIGMGLNLEIKRIVFESTTKFNGLAVVPLSTSEVRQIGGRAGRYRSARQDALGIGGGEEGKESKIGYVTTLENADLSLVQTAFEQMPEPVTKCMIQPPAEMIEAFASHFPEGTPLSFILQRIRDMATVNPRYKLTIKNESLDIADVIQEFPLSIYDRVALLAAPASPREAMMREVLREMARRLSERSSGHLLDIPQIPLELLESSGTATTTGDYLRSLEVLGQTLTLYTWVSYRFSGVFPSQELAFHARDLVHEKINLVLDTISRPKRDMDKAREERRNLAYSQERKRKTLLQGEKEDEKEDESQSADDKEDQEWLKGDSKNEEEALLIPDSAALEESARTVAHAQ